MRDKEIRFAELRKDKGLKQWEIAEVLNVLEDRYSKWERGIDDISLENSNILAKFYDVSLDYLLGLSDYSIKTSRKELDLKLFCKRLLHLRKERNLTQEKLGKELGFPQRTYANYEKGSSVPTTLKVYCIALYYNVSLDYLVGRSDDKEIKIR